MMKIETNELWEFVLKEVYNDIILQTEEGNKIVICMRDDTFDINVLPKKSEEGCLYRVIMETKEIIKYKKSEE